MYKRALLWNFRHRNVRTHDKVCVDPELSCVDPELSCVDPELALQTWQLQRHEMTNFAGEFPFPACLAFILHTDTARWDYIEAVFYFTLLYHAVEEIKSIASPVSGIPLPDTRDQGLGTQAYSGSFSGSTRLRGLRACLWFPRHWK